MAQIGNGVQTRPELEKSAEHGEENDTVSALRADLSSINADLTSPPINSPSTKFRGSICWTEGFEKNLHVLAKDQYAGRAMGVFTSGGDAQEVFH
ncbi:unnamed protein product [Adineta ricciae]|uniref:Uncharacterized protein n=1 Tax=Adineta ricciae TaxID=249248 RepID=A0A813WEM9_ADIRI|nr:unnamed protein product [Adineta ricciae]